MMKLRIRSMETKETIRVEAPNSSSLLDLKTLISSKVSSSPPIAPQSISLSLNRKDEIAGGDSLQTLGLASGDLIYYSLTSFTQPLTLTSDQPRDMEVEKKKETPPPASEILTLEQTLDSPDPTQDMEIEMKKSTPSISETLDPPNPGSPISEPDQDMDVEEDEEMKEPGLSIPGFLRRVMELEKEGVKGELGFLVIAIHAVFLESGFVVCHGNGLDRLPKDWNLATSAISIRYTLPDLLQQKDAKAATLRFSAMGKFVSVYGFLTGEGSPEVYRLCLDSAKVAPLLALSDLDLAGGDKEKEVFNLWKVVKDGLCLPLLIDICQKNGLPAPPCFARLPTDLKIMVLELLPGADVAKVGCASSELRYLSDTDELWKQKFVEEFGPANEKEATAVGSWKDKFKKHWLRRRECNRMTLRIKNGPLVPWGRRMPRFPLYAPYAPRRFPIIGGDHDLYPFMGDSFPVGMSGFGFPHMSRRQNFSPHCNLSDDSRDFIG